jgi:hypothetical protein
VFDQVKNSEFEEILDWGKGNLHMVDPFNFSDLFLRFNGVCLYKLKELFNKFRQVDIKNFVLMVIRILNVKPEQQLFLAIQAKNLFQHFTKYKKTKVIKFSDFMTYFYDYQWQIQSNKDQNKKVQKNAVRFEQMKTPDTLSHKTQCKKACFSPKKSWVISMDEGAEELRIYDLNLKIV